MIFKRLYFTITCCFLQSTFSFTQNTDQIIENYLKSDVDQKLVVLFENYGDIEGLSADTILYFIRDLQKNGIQKNREDVLAFSNYYFGNYLNDQGFFLEAEKKLKAAKEFFSFREVDSMLASVYNALGNNEYLQGKIKAAEAYYLKSHHHGKKSDIGKFEHFALANLGRIYIGQKKYDEAKQILEDYIAYNKKAENFRNVGTGYGLMSQLYLDQEKFDEATEFLERSMEYNLSTGNPKLIANGYTNVAIAHYIKEDYERAEKNFHLALAYRKKAGDPFFIAESYYNLGDFYLGQEQADSALVYYTKSYEIAKENNNQLGEKDALIQLAAVFEEKKMHKEEAEKLKEYIAVVEELNAEKLSRELNILRTSFEEELELNSYQGHQREEILRDRVAETNRIWDYWIWIVLGGILVLTGVIYFAPSRKK
ncbi:MAG: tetratricopeptide repeat protein [Brumimicrobium sp.]|nr:tetratricopeptide repeat protein [Brumimicrobium sp.]